MWKKTFESEFAKTIVPLVALLGAWLMWKSDAAPAAVHDVVVDMRNADRNELDLQMLTRNYYEELNVVDRGRWSYNKNFVKRMLALVGVEMNQSAEDKAGNYVRITESGATRPGREYVEYELIPNTDIIWRGLPLKINQWGMRDKEYELKRPANTFRIALAGASNSMGHGVAVEHAYPEVLEAMLNENIGKETGTTFEVLNFSVAGYTLLDDLYILENIAIDFEPNLMIIVGTQHDLRWRVSQDVSARTMKGLDLNFDFVNEAVAQAKLQPGDSELQVRRRLKPFSDMIVGGVFVHLKKFAEEHGLHAMAIHLHLRTVPVDDMLRRQADLSEQMNMSTLRIFDALVGKDPDDVYIEITDQHPTEYGHRLIAEELYQDMLSEPAIGDLIRPKAGPN